MNGDGDGNDVTRNFTQQKVRAWPNSYESTAGDDSPRG